MILKPIPLVLLGVLLGGALASSAEAQVPADLPQDEQQQKLETLIELNTRAITEYRAGRHDQSRELLVEALSLAESNGLGDHDMAARTHVHLGIVAIAGLGLHDQGLQHFAEAQRIRPGIKLTRQLATARLQRDFRAAAKLARLAPPKAPAKEAPTVKLAVAAAPGGEQAAGHRAGEEPDVPVEVPQPLYCPTPIEGPPQEDVRLHCLIQASVRAEKVILYYRPGTGETYTPVTMNRTPKGLYSAVIPAKQVTGRALQFYFEALESDRIAAANGKGELPNVIVLKPGAPRVGEGALAALDLSGGRSGYQENRDEETPLEARERAQGLAARTSTATRRAPGRFWAGLGVGSSWGWHLRRPLERHTDRQVSEGFSPAGLGHATPELGYQLTPRLALSLQGRHQYLPPSGAGDPDAGRGPPRTAHAVLARAIFALAGAGDLQFLGTISAGYGTALRMKVEPAPSQGLVSSDTIVAGPGVAGPGLGLAYHFTPWLLASLEARALAGFPSFGVLGEATAWLQVAF